MAEAKFTVAAAGVDAREIEARINTLIAERKAADPEYAKLPKFILPEAVAAKTVETGLADVLMKDAHFEHLMQTINATKDSSAVPEGVRLRRLKKMIQKIIRVHSRLQNFFNEAVAGILEILPDRTQAGFDELSRQVQELGSQMADARAHFASAASSVEEMLEVKFGTVMEAVSEFEARLKTELAGLNEEFIELARSVKEPAFRVPEWAADAFDYTEFERKYYGSCESIAEKQEGYVKYFKGCSKVLDFGCGSGGFLHACREAGISAVGVDISKKLVESCLEAGLEAETGDGIEFLRGQTPGAFDGIFCAQVLEHFYPAELVEFFRLCGEKTNSGAVMVIELPNIRNLGILARSFYSDLSHVRPYSAEIISFLGAGAGFGAPEIITSSPMPDEAGLDEIRWEGENVPDWVSVINRNTEKLNSILAGDQDIAFVFRKA